MISFGAMSIGKSRQGSARQFDSNGGADFHKPGGRTIDTWTGETGSALKNRAHGR